MWTRASQVYAVSSDSMAPTIAAGDRLVARKISAICPGLDVRRGDIVILDMEEDDDHPQLLVKRVVALGGDDVVLDDNGLMVNGARATGPVFQTESEPRRSTLGWREATIMARERLQGEGTWIVAGASHEPAWGESIRLIVPADHVFVMGDNRAHSRDSRHFGAVHISHLEGRVVRTFFGDEGALFGRSLQPRASRFCPDGVFGIDAPWARF